jgi:hypothetical protein
MKIAICFYGLVGSLSDKNGQGIPIDPSIGYKYYKENIFDTNDEVDIFIHSWSVNSKDKLIELYNPKKHIIEKQVPFPNSKNHPVVAGKGFDKIKMFILKLLKRKSYDYVKRVKEKEAFRAYSRWYSVKESVQLMRDYELEHDFEYDCVMTTRLDVAFFKPVVFNQYDMNYFHASHWNDPKKIHENKEANRLNHYKDEGFLDFWFFSSSKLIYQFSKLFDSIEKYPISPHFSSRKHLDTLTNKVKFVFYRWYDHEMIRRKKFNSEK